MTQPSHEHIFPKDSPLICGDRIGGEEGFVVEDFVGGGGFAYIYKVHDLNRRTTAAMKVLRPSSESGESRERFEREILVLGHLSSNPYTPNLIRRGSCPSPHAPERTLDWFVMDYVEGLTLKEALEEARRGAHLVQGYHFDQGRMDPLDVLTLLRMIVRCLEQLHKLEEARHGESAEFTGYIHRDLKCVNIMLPHVVEGYPAHVMVLDFGIAGVYHKDGRELPVDHNITTTGHGGTFTPKYAAPEQVLGASYGPYTDFYSLGVIAYECLTGAHPYDDIDLMKRDSRRKMLMRTVTPSHVIRLPDEPRFAGVAPLIHAMLSQDEADRPATARQLYEMLSEVQIHQPSQATEGAKAPERTNLITQDWSVEAARLASQEFDETQVPREAFFKLDDDRRTEKWNAVSVKDAPPQEERSVEVKEDTARLFDDEAKPNILADAPHAPAESDTLSDPTPAPVHKELMNAKEQGKVVAAACIVLLLAVWLGSQVMNTPDEVSSPTSLSVLEENKNETEELVTTPSLPLTPSLEAAALVVAKSHEAAQRTLKKADSSESSGERGSQEVPDVVVNKTKSPKNIEARVKESRDDVKPKVSAQVDKQEEKAEQPKKVEPKARKVAQSEPKKESPKEEKAQSSPTTKPPAKEKKKNIPDFKTFLVETPK